jgi:prophage regulatory protein
MKIIKLIKVKDKTSLSRSTLYRLMGEGRFPKPINLCGGRSVGWLESEIDNFLLERVAKRDKGV